MRIRCILRSIAIWMLVIVAIPFHAMAEPTETAAIKRVEKTRQFRRLEKQVKNPLMLMTDNDGNDFRDIGVYEDGPDAYCRCDTFRVYDDGRLMIWDYDKDDWTTAKADGK